MRVRGAYGATQTVRTRRCRLPPTAPAQVTAPASPAGAVAGRPLLDVPRRAPRLRCRVCGAAFDGGSPAPYRTICPYCVAGGDIVTLVT